MPIPETTSAEAFPLNVGEMVLRIGRGKAWREFKIWLIAPPRDTDLVSLPLVGKPFLACVVPGKADLQEWENVQPWITHRIRKGSFCSTTGGTPYHCRWKMVSTEPLEAK